MKRRNPLEIPGWARKDAEEFGLLGRDSTSREERLVRGPKPWRLTGNKTIDGRMPAHGVTWMAYPGGTDHPLCYLEFPTSTRRTTWRMDQFRYKGEILIDHQPKPGQRRREMRRYVLLAYEPQRRRKSRKPRRV